MSYESELGARMIWTLFGIDPAKLIPGRHMRPARPSPVVGAVVRVCPGGRQAWHECPSLGRLVRKPTDPRHR